MRVWWKPKGVEGIMSECLGTAVVLFMDVIDLIPNHFCLICWFDICSLHFKLVYIVLLIGGSNYILNKEWVSQFLIWFCSHFTLNILRNYTIIWSKTFSVIQKLWCASISYRRKCWSWIYQKFIQLAIITVVPVQTQSHGKITETRGTSVRSCAECMLTWTSDTKPGKVSVMDVFERNCCLLVNNTICSHWSVG
jgi:hypothetical protein